MAKASDNIEAKLAAYIDGELDAAGRAEIEKYLVANPAQQKLVNELMSQHDAIGALPRVNSPVDISDALGAQLERAALLGDIDVDGGLTGGSTGPNWQSQFRAIAAVLILTVGLAAVVYWVLPSPKARPPQVAVVTPDDPDKFSQTQQTFGSAPIEDAKQQAQQGTTQQGVIQQAPLVSKVGAEPTEATQKDVTNSPAPAMGAGGSMNASANAAMTSPAATPMMPTFTESAASMYVVVRSPDPQASLERVTQMLGGAQLSYQEVSATADMLALADSTKREAMRVSPPPAPAPSEATNGPPTTQPEPGSAIAERDIASNVAAQTSGVASSIGKAKEDVAASRSEPSTRPVESDRDRGSVDARVARTSQRSSDQPTTAPAEPANDALDLRHQESFAPRPAAPSPPTTGPTTNASAPTSSPSGGKERVILVRDVPREQAVELGRALAQPALRQTAEVLDRSGERKELQQAQSRVDLAPSSQPASTQPATQSAAAQSNATLSMSGASTTQPSTQPTTQPGAQPTSPTATLANDRVDLVIVVREDAAPTPTGASGALPDRIPPTASPASPSAETPVTQPATQPTTRP